MIIRGGEETSGHANYRGVGIDFSFRAKITLFVYCEVLEKEMRSTLLRILLLKVNLLSF